eukprot:TRINITY_DN14348_c0_g1_i1.p1 TRINITY_DN14348_c0_g1~~TRINITY_DN14348_c0_g1_i1.p1  ORF type:complete len:256 (+),score=34.73 TRINITY_DN14348_c0_g1_i1:47-769(+)
MSRTQTLAKALIVHETEASFLSQDTKQKLFRQEISSVPGAFLLHHVLTKEECQKIIDFTELLGYTEAPISTGLNSAKMMKDIRDNRRVMWKANDETLEIMWERVKPHLPKIVNSGGVIWELLENEDGLNERFRFYSYSIGERFMPHYDGSFPRTRNCQSHFTFIIYLNEGMDGGETTFYIDGEEYNGNDQNVVRVNPTTGTALLFRHTGLQSPLHEGTEHRSPNMKKYVLRSDIMYQKQR